MKKEYVALYAGIMIISSTFIYVMALQISSLNNNVQLGPQSQHYYNTPSGEIPSYVGDYFRLIQDGEFNELQVRSVFYKAFNACLTAQDGVVVYYGREISCSEVLADEDFFEEVIDILVHFGFHDVGGVDAHSDISIEDKQCSADYCQIGMILSGAYILQQNFYCDKDIIEQVHIVGYERTDTAYLRWTETIQKEDACRHFNP